MIIVQWHSFIIPPTISSSTTMTAVTYLMPWIKLKFYFSQNMHTYEFVFWPNLIKENKWNINKVLVNSWNILNKVLKYITVITIISITIIIESTINAFKQLWYHKSYQICIIWTSWHNSLLVLTSLIHTSFILYIYWTNRSPSFCRYGRFMKILTIGGSEPTKGFFSIYISLLGTIKQYLYI